MLHFSSNGGLSEEVRYKASHGGKRYKQCDQKKIAKSLQKFHKNDFTRNMKYLTPLQKLPKNRGDWGKLIVAKGFKKLPKVQKIARSGHTGYLSLVLDVLTSK